MDWDFTVDIEEALRNVQTAEVLSIILPLLQKTLLVDTRYDASQGPLVKVVPMAGSVEERLRSLSRIRPHFPQPQRLAIIPWPRRVINLKTLGIWDRIMERLAESGDPVIERTAGAILEKLVAQERAETDRALTGEGYHTLWSAND